MASAVADDSEAYQPSDESEDLIDEHEYDDEDEDEDRPNRWRGPKSTWQQHNSEEIDTIAALKEIGDRDLSVHLYTAFALKQRHRKRQDKVVGGPVAGKVY